MASLFTLPSGTRRIQFTNGAGARRAIYLENVLLADAEKVKTKVEAILSAQMSRRAIDAELAKWLADITDALHIKLEKVGLIGARQQQGDAAAMLGPFLAAYIKERDDVKGSTSTVYGHTKRNLVEFFGERKLLSAITLGDADEFKRFLTRKKLKTSKRPMAKNTVIKRCQIAKQFFQAATRKRLIASNPFADMKGATIKANRERDHFITAQDAVALDGKAPDAQWRLIIALSRYGGLRCPSEHLALKWDDIDWERNRMTVHAPKTEHRPGQESRIIPIFPELLRPLLEVSELAPKGAEFVITRYRDASQNLRTQFMKIIKRAGLDPWPRLFHNMRASRQTELTARFPLHVVCEWLGNSRLIAQEHYLRVRDEDFDLAIRGVLRDAYTTQQNKETADIVSHPRPKECENPQEIAGFPQYPGDRGWSLLDSNQ